MSTDGSGTTGTTPDPTQHPRLTKFLQLLEQLTQKYGPQIAQIILGLLSSGGIHLPLSVIPGGTSPQAAYDPAHAERELQKLDGAKFDEVCAQAASAAS